MNREDIKAIVTLPIVILIGIGIAFAGSQYNISQIMGLPLFAFCVALAFVIQWLVFIPSFLFQTEKLFDITGSITYISVTLIAVVLNPKVDARSLILMIMVIIWAGRLGTFLVRRIHKAGKDQRFDDIKPHFFRFLNTWTLQGLWVTFTLAAALVVFTTPLKKDLSWFAYIGILIWLVGFTFESVADLQKNRFRAKPENKGKFIHTGLWSISRHPNYFGEIVIWIGVAVIALPVLRGWQWITLISPVFVALLLIKISGIPKLEQYADKKWGGQEDYEDYTKKTPVLVPKIISYSKNIIPE